jgi:predicted nuclease with TOPRIM domain
MVTVIDPLTGEKLQIERPVTTQSEVNAAGQVAQANVQSDAKIAGGAAMSEPSASTAVDPQDTTDLMVKPDTQKDEISQLKAQLDSVMEIMAQHSKDIDTLLADRTGKLEALEKSAVEDQANAEMIEKLEAEIEDQKSHIAELENDKVQLQTQLVEAVAAKQELLQVKERLEAEKEELIAQTKDLKGKNTWLRKLNKDQASEIKKQAERIKEIQNKLAFQKNKPIMPGWKIVGMTEDEAIFYDNYRLLRLKKGEKYNNVLIQGLDVESGVVTTNYGEIVYQKAQEKKQQAAPDVSDHSNIAMTQK